VTQPVGERERSFVELYERHYPAVYAYALRRTDEASARDVAAETFLVAWRRQDEVGSRELPWLLRTAQLALRNSQRAGRRQQRTAGRLATEPAVLVEDPADSYDDGAAVRVALLALSGEDRELLRLVAWEQLDNAAVAAVLGCSTGTAAVRLHRARRRLRRALAVTRAPDGPRPPAPPDPTPTTRKAAR